MLSILHIENIALIERADIEPGPGLVVLTGETGAGKSIIIDALGAALGGRTSRDLVRSGSDGARVSAGFTGVTPETGQWCAGNDIDCGEGELVLTRRISPDGKSSCRVNGIPVTAAQLKQLGALLLDIHGQNDGQKLLSESYHLACLDGYGGHEAVLANYGEAYGAYRETVRRIEELSMDESEKLRRVDALTYRIEELEGVRLRAGEAEELETWLKRLRNAEKLSAAVNAAYEAIYGDGGAVELLGAAETELNSVSRYTDELEDTAGSVAGLRYSAQDLAERLRDYRDGLDFAPGELDELETRLELLRRLMRKYAADEEGLFALIETSRAELEAIEYSADRLKELERERGERYEKVLALAGSLSQARKGAAGTLETRVMNELRALNMPSVRFVAEFTPTEPGSRGADEVKFLMSANAGEEPGRISRIASGGELSRIMLAIKNVLAERDATPAVVFDEVDSGVSGIAAQRVGEKLAELGRTKQVLCVTHLPQIAAMADMHLCIEKSERDGRTYTEVAVLDFEGRKREIARITGGDNITGTTLSSAEEQLRASEAFKAAL